MTTRFLFVLVTWSAVLIALYGFIFSTESSLLVVPRVVGWALFIIFCAFSLTNCIVRPKPSAFWIGVTVFSVTALFCVMLSDVLYQPTLGAIVSDIVVFRVFDRDNADAIEILRQDHARSVTDLLLATVMAVVGGLVGQILGRERAKPNENQ